MKSFLAAYTDQEPGVAALFARMPDALLREGAEAAAWEPSLAAAIEARDLAARYPYFGIINAAL